MHASAYPGLRITCRWSSGAVARVIRCAWAWYALVSLEFYDILSYV